jgi:hypothetical protein
MTPTSSPPLNRTQSVHSPLPWVILALWFALAFALARAGLFELQGAGVPFPLALAATIPPILFLGAHATLAPVRSWVAGLDMALVTGVQCWRVIGAVFLILWAMGDLPTIFAFSAGYGDLAVGALALPVTIAAARRSPGWQAKSRALIIIGLADFVLAFGTAILTGANMPLQFAGEPLPLPMQVLPMALIPCFGVPLFAIFHLIAWQKLRAEA